MSDPFIAWPVTKPHLLLKRSSSHPHVSSSSRAYIGVTVSVWPHGSVVCVLRAIHRSKLSQRVDPQEGMYDSCSPTASHCLDSPTAASERPRGRCRIGGLVPRLAAFPERRGTAKGAQRSDDLGHPYHDRTIL